MDSPTAASQPEYLGTRTRTMTEKGQEYSISIKERTATNREKDFRAKLNQFENHMRSSRYQDEIKGELLTLTTEADTCVQAYDEWISLLENTTDSQLVNDRRKCLIDTWQTIYTATQQRLRQLHDDDTKSISSLGSARTRHSVLSSTSSRILLNFKAKRAALEERKKLTATIADQEKKLAELKLQREIEEVKAQEAVYERATEKDFSRHEVENLGPLPPSANEGDYAIPAFLKDTCGASSTPVTTTLLPTTTANLEAKTQLFGHLLLPPSSFPSTPNIYSAPRTQHQNKHTETTVNFSTGRQDPIVMPTLVISTTSSSQAPPQWCTSQPTPEYISPSSYRPFIPYNYNSQFAPVYVHPSQDNSLLLTDTISKVTQLQRLPQAKPDTFKGDEKDKTKYFLWETAFDALVDSVPITPQQKLHLLYQHLDGKAKRVVEQLQYMVQEPEKAYSHARKILKERFGHQAIIGTEFERKLLAWPKIAPTDAVALEEFGDFLRQIETASEHFDSLKAFNFPSQIQLLVEKLPGWFKAKWSDKVIQAPEREGKGWFPII